VCEKQHRAPTRQAVQKIEIAVVAAGDICMKLISLCKPSVFHIRRTYKLARVIPTFVRSDDGERAFIVKIKTKLAALFLSGYIFTAVSFGQAAKTNITSDNFHGTRLDPDV
jgi:hypothetical protein